MNRILLNQDELDAKGQACLTDRRAHHLLNVLRAVPGQTVRIGVLNGGRGVGEVLACKGGEVTLACSLDEESAPPARVSLMLGLPRPKVLKRLWAPLASLGLRRVVLTNAEKVERCYFDTHWLNEAQFRPRLIEGLEQSGDTGLPEILVRKRLKAFIEDELDALFPAVDRFVCHPRDAQPIRCCVTPATHEILLAIGPEGGWSEYELDLFAAYGFARVRSGARVLRSDVAVIALVALAQDALDQPGIAACESLPAGAVGRTPQ